MVEDEEWKRILRGRERGKKKWTTASPERRRKDGVLEVKGGEYEGIVGKKAVESNRKEERRNRKGRGEVHNWKGWKVKERCVASGWQAQSDQAILYMALSTVPLFSSCLINSLSLFSLFL